MMDDYKDIIDLPHHISRKHPAMSREKRAAQFAPFAALTGHSAAIKETGRYTEDQMILDENTFDQLDDKLALLNASLREKPEVTITYFSPDSRKSGGTYVSIQGIVTKIDFYEKTLNMEDGPIIPMQRILSMESPLFSCMDQW